MSTAGTGVLTRRTWTEVEDGKTIHQWSVEGERGVINFAAQPLSSPNGLEHVWIDGVPWLAWGITTHIPADRHLDQRWHEHGSTPCPLLHGAACCGEQSVGPARRLLVAWANTKCDDEVIWEELEDLYPIWVAAKALPKPNGLRAMIAELREAREACFLGWLAVDAPYALGVADEPVPRVHVRDVEGQRVAEFFNGRRLGDPAANAAFYAAAYHAVPVLLHEITRLRREIFGQSQRGAELLYAARALRDALDGHQGELTDEQIVLVDRLSAAAGPEKREGS